MIFDINDALPLVFDYLTLIELVRVDTAVLNRACREVWLLALQRLPPLIFDRTRFTHDKLRWIISRGIRRLTVLQLEQARPVGLRESSFLGCCWPALAVLDLCGARLRQQQSTYFTPVYPPPVSEKIFLENINHITASSPGLRSVNLDGESMESIETALDLLTQRSPSLESISVEGSGFSLRDSALVVLSRLPLLHSLSLQGASGITDQGLALLLTVGPETPHSSSAEDYEDEDEEGMERRLLSLPPRPISLRALNLNQCAGISTVGIKLLAAACSTLRSLALADVVHVTDKAIVAIATRNPQLTELVLNRCYRIGDTALRALCRHCPCLEELRVEGCVNVTDDCVKTLRTRQQPLGVPCLVWI